MKTLAFLLLAACSPTAMSTPADHPANPDAPIGRLAGPPAALRPGVAASPPGGQPSADHSGHGAVAPSAPADQPAVDHSGHGAAPADKPAVDHSGHGAASPATVTPKKAAKKPAKKPATKPATKPAATPPPKNEAVKPAPAKPIEKPAQPDPHEGHH